MRKARHFPGLQGENGAENTWDLRRIYAAGGAGAQSAAKASAACSGVREVTSSFRVDSPAYRGR